MQIPSNWWDYLIGAVSALAFVRWKGWLKIPYLDGAPFSFVSMTSPPRVNHEVHDEVPDGAQSVQSYSAIIDIPHKITVTPQEGRK